uniref:Leucine-rich repeat domain-containing protein n=1 Tax=viral metagenome TaxID=1070528 RepID=A0A6C0JU29_9ZZZZ
MSAYDLSQSLPKVQQIFTEFHDRLEERLKEDRTATNWSPEGFIEADPTPNKIYLRWIVNSYILRGIKLYEDVLSRVQPALTDYFYLVESGNLDQGEPGKPWTNERNIDNYCGLAGCTKPSKASQSKKASKFISTTSSTVPTGFTQHGIDELLDKYQTILQKRKTELKETEQVHADTEISFKTDEVTVYHPKTKEASCYYGQGTKWCTASTKSSNMFDTYNKDGPLYIIVPKDPKKEGEKYQMHVQSQSLMNKKDNAINIFKLLKKYPSLSSFDQVREFNKKIDLGDKNLKSLDGYDLSGVIELNCENNRLKTLPVLPPTLQKLICGDNELSDLGDFPDGLIEVDCRRNQIIKLPKLPASLKRLICSDNPLKELPALPLGLKWLDIDYTKIKQIQPLPYNLGVSCDYDVEFWGIGKKKSTKMINDGLGKHKNYIKLTQYNLKAKEQGLPIAETLPSEEQYNSVVFKDFVE